MNHPISTRYAAGERAFAGADLRCANLAGAVLSGANLAGANLAGANLRAADLIGAYLQSANLRGADLSGAYLQSANLRGANLRGAYLQSANLCSADLSGAVLSGADLIGVDLRSADLRGADLIGANLGDQWIIQGGCRSDGYWFFLQRLTGDVEPMVKAGCRYLSVPDALSHWKAKRGGTPLGEESIALVIHLQDIAKIRGLI